MILRNSNKIFRMAKIKNMLLVISKTFFKKQTISRKNCK